MSINIPIRDKNYVISYKHGSLYNWYAVNDVRNLANTGYHVARDIEYWAIVQYLDPAAIWGSNVAGGPMKEVGIYWNVPNVGATNLSNFNGRGSGYRDIDGAFTDILNYLVLWNQEEYDIDDAEYSSLTASNSQLVTSGGGGWIGNPKKRGQSVRLVNDSTILTNGQTGNYIGNDGKQYNTIAIGNPAIEIMSVNLCESLYRTGAVIPIVSDNTTWASLITGAVCAYNNDWSNVY